MADGDRRVGERHAAYGSFALRQKRKVLVSSGQDRRAVERTGKLRLGRQGTDVALCRGLASLGR